MCFNWNHLDVDYNRGSPLFRSNLFDSIKVIQRTCKHFVKLLENIESRDILAILFSFGFAFQNLEVYLDPLKRLCGVFFPQKPRRDVWGARPTPSGDRWSKKHLSWKYADDADRPFTIKWCICSLKPYQTTSLLWGYSPSQLLISFIHLKLANGDHLPVS